MQVSVEKRDGLERCMTVELPIEDFEKAVEGRLKNLARTVKMDGFRPGKVPMSVVKTRLGGQARQEALDEAIQSSLYQAMNQEKLRPAGSPQVEFLPLEEGKGPKYAVTFEIMPELTLSDMKSAKIETPVVDITDADIDTTIDSIRGQKLDWKDVKRKSKKEDQVTIDFVGKLDDVAFDGGTGTDVKVVLGAGQFIPDFEKGLMGVKTGEESVIDATFPAEYGNADLAGKTVQFATTIKAVCEPVLPEVDEDFVKAMGVEAGTVEALREQVKDNMSRELAQVIREVTKTNVMDAIIDAHKLELPQVMVNDEIKRLAEQTRQMFAQQGVPMPDAPIDDSLYQDQAVRRVSLGLIMSEIVSTQEIAATADKVRAAVEEIAAPYEQPEEIINYYYADKSRLGEIEAVVLEQGVVDWVLENAKTVEKKEKFEELMASRKG
ncbi:MAG: trigger factor [Sulfuriflexus sp.]|nr:trigger factor [Sulfuriflexus sp.]